MALQSKFFCDEPKLEAAANIDSAHITPGARGPHVEKIQTALNILDSAGLGVEGTYGPATAKAVLNYKTKLAHASETPAQSGPALPERSPRTAGEGTFGPPHPWGNHYGVARCLKEARR